MSRRYGNICPYCKGRLDPGEKCDCRELNGRAYTAIEGAGYRMGMIGYRGKKETRRG